MPSTIAARHEHHSAPVRGSRFRGIVVPVSSVAEAESAVAAIRAADPDATHHAWALRLRNGTVMAQDDGEVGGTAGRPILARLEGGDLVDVLLIVSRWYGGTKLGTGGLVRAYGGCATETLDGAAVEPWAPQATLTIIHDYADGGAIDGVLTALGATAGETAYDARVTRTLTVPADLAERVASGVRNATAGRAVIDVEPTRPAARD